MNSVQEADVAGKKIILRADLDLAERDGRLETFRLTRLIPTLKSILDRGGTARIIAHRGRPEGKPDLALSTEPFAALLSEQLDQPVSFAGDVTENPDPAGAAVLFENLRFHPGEEANSPEFVQALLKLGELYVNESFATVHRAHASIASLPKYLPHFGGLNLLQEIANLTRVMQNPDRPLLVIIGGAKVETKRPLIEYMQNIADEILVGGSLMNEGLKPLERVVMPVDEVGGKDIGHLTIERFRQSIGTAKTVVWNGPLGVFEDPQFSAGTKAVAEAVAGGHAFSVVGGGDTIAALDQFGLLNKISFVSTGGGAMLEFLSGRSLPGLEALE
jgi:phosphoglycerate kinase